MVTALLGDGSYLMLNSELFSAAFAGHPFVAVVCDNGGYAVIHRLQTGQGGDGFNNLFVDSAGPGAKPGGVAGRFRRARRCAGLRGRRRRRPAPPWTSCAPATPRRVGLAKAERRPAVVVCRVSPSAWTESGAWWEVGVPAALSGRAGYDEAKRRQLRWTR